MTNFSTQVGSIEIVESVADIKGALQKLFCAAVSIQEIVPDSVIQAIQGISASNLRNLRGVTIEGGRDAELRIRSHDVSSRPLECPSVSKAFGLPAALVPLMKQDHLDYLAATDCEYAISSLRVGDDLTVSWHDDKNMTAGKPQAHRDLSGHGMYLASANRSVALPIESETHSGRFYADSILQQSAEQGDVLIRRQKIGERLYFRAGFLHKSAFQWYEREPERPHLRLLTRGPLSG